MPWIILSVGRNYVNARRRETLVGYGLGLDLGTAFTAAAVSRDGGAAQVVRLTADSPLLPSTVRVGADGACSVSATGHPQIVGHLARRTLGDSAPLAPGQPGTTAADVLSTLLTHAVDRVTRTLGERPARVVLTHPAVWGPYRREQFAEVARRAGLPGEQVLLITEAEAVTVDHLQRLPDPGREPILVYDCGGGTFDATVTGVRPEHRTGVQVLGTPESVEWFGGVDLDNAVLTHLDRQTEGAVGLLDPARPQDAERLERIRRLCVQAKEQLSETGPDGEATLHVVLPGREHRIRLRRSQLEEWLAPYLAAAVPTLRRALDSADLDAGDPAAVLFVGGSARIPSVAREIAQDLGRRVLVGERPQLAAALGAARVAGQVSAHRGR